MSDISSISETTPAAAELTFNEEKLEKVSDLCAKGAEAIENNDFDRARAIIIAIDKNQYSGEVRGEDFCNLLQKLWNKDPSQGEKLLPLVKESWSISVKDNRVFYNSLKSGDRGSFSFERKTTPEGDALLDKAYPYFCKRNYEAFKPAFQEVLEGGKNQLISIKDLFNFICDLAFKNATALESFLPLINDYFPASFQEDFFSIASSGYSIRTRSQRFSLRNLDYAMKVLSKSETPGERVRLSILIATLHPSKMDELLEKGCAELKLITDLEEKLDEGFWLANCCFDNKKFHILPTVLSEIESINESNKDEVERLRTHFQVLLFRIGISLNEKNKKSFNLHLSAAKNKLAKMTDPEEREEMKNILREYTEESNEVFGIDPLVMQASKV